MALGFSRYHSVGLLVPLIAALSPMLLSRMHWGAIPGPLNAVLGGAGVALVAYLVFAYAGVLREPQALAKAVLLGVLVAETMIFHSSFHVPSMTAISLFLFLYFYSSELTGSKLH